MSSRTSFSVYEVGGLATDLVASDFEVYKAGVLDTSIAVIPNNDGTYYFEIEETAKYRIKVKGTWQDEYYDIYLVSDDNLVQGDVDDSTLEYDSNLHIKALGVGTAQLAALSVTTAKIAADAIDGTKIADDSLDSEHYVADSIDDEHINWGTAVNQVSGSDLPIADSGGYYPTNQVEAALQQIGLKLGLADGALDFSTTNFIASLSSVQAALLKLDQVANLIESASVLFWPILNHTMTGDASLAIDVNPVVFVDCGGASRNLSVGQEADMANKMYVMFNVSGAGEVLTVKDDGAAYTIATIEPNEGAIMFCNGTVWKGFVGAET